VLVCTPSATVGREFDVVAVAGLQESVWPNLRLRGSLLHPQDLDDALAGRRAAVAGDEGQDTADQRAEVLSDELRMFALAVSRARRQVLLTATANDDEQPSPFLRLAAELAVEDDDPGIHPLSLRGMVGRLRRRLVTTGSPDAADALARLADAGVEGADPADWYGLAEPSTTEPLIDLDDPDAMVKVSPSRLGTFEKSPLAWFVDEMAASPSGLAAGIGTVVHAVMEEAAATDETSVELLWSGIERRWSQLQFESPWIEERERRRTRGLVAGVSEYLRDFGRAGGRLLGSEGEFQLELGRARISGKIDRVEETPDGTVVIVDLKTGRTVPTAAETASHAQLGVYQLALEHGAVEHDAMEASELPPGGAKLLFVAKGVRGKAYREVVQERVDAEALVRLEERVARAAEGMAGATFAGVVDLGDRDPHAAYGYRIHLVPAVSA
jgi:RecB family exonuclease